ncbi:hypothetical protein IEQ34_007147 [Dendrobium chrysotoxum]|uniref:Uncharacterized protein n=1 Tax=Dendrobium chrysotoxum TaxID=161865 RepID=A0AAV7H709_DENCH|nr:hypothetical protein IEQ34_007147 [Dendrobium chrysotoxum]
MAEIYTKPFESVQAAITLFEQKIDPKICSTSSSKEERGEFFKDLTDDNLLLEAKAHQKSLAFFEFDVSSKNPEELLALLKLYKAERDSYKEKFRKSQALFLEYEKGNHFFRSFSNLEADESMTAAQRKAEIMKTELNLEEGIIQKLWMHNSEIKKVILPSQVSNIDAKKDSPAFCTPNAEVFLSHIQLEVLRRYLDEMEDLENELLKQMIISEYLHMELKQSKEAQTIFSKDVLSATNELDLVKSENKRMKQVNSESELYIRQIKEEGERMKEELNISAVKINDINCQSEMLVGEIQRMQQEMSESKNKELEFHPNAVILTSELHNSSSRIAAAKDSEARSMSSQAELNQAIQHLAVEAEEAKTEVRRLAAEYNKVETENEEGRSNKNSAFNVADADSNEFCTGITISMEEYEFLIQKSEMADNRKCEPTDGYEVNKLKIELEDKNEEISELTCKLEETERRAELAEKAKVAVESQLRKWREQRQLRRAASDAVKEYCATKNEANKQHDKPLLSKLACINPESDGVPSHPKRSVSRRDGRKSKYVPLGKLLKIKF